MVQVFSSCSKISMPSLSENSRYLFSSTSWLAQKSNKAFLFTTPYKPSCSFGLAEVGGLRVCDGAGEIVQMQCCPVTTWRGWTCLQAQAQNSWELEMPRGPFYRKLKSCMNGREIGASDIWVIVKETGAWDTSSYCCFWVNLHFVSHCIYTN